MLADFAVAVDVAGDALRLIKHQALEELDDESAVGSAQPQIAFARIERFAAVPADYLIQGKARSVVAVGRCRAHAPKRWRSPLFDDRAVKLHLVKRLADIVILK